MHKIKHTKLQKKWYWNRVININIKNIKEMNIKEMNLWYMQFFICLSSLTVTTIVWCNDECKQYLGYL